MRGEVYDVEARVSDTHWWFAGRRRLLARLIGSLAPAPSWRVLEVGAGTGANLPVLRALGVRQVIACDLAAEAQRHQDAGVFTRADAARLPFASASIDLLLAADVIEHLADDRAALREFVRVLRPGGHLLVTVPAFPSLWGPQDIVAHHHRRYRRAPLLALLGEAGVRVVSCFHFNYLLFLPIWAARRILLACRVQVDSENEINTPIVNRLLTRVFFADVDSAPALRPPFGVSLCAVATKETASA
jgi:SAM-dependent methyltransferase